ncbi:MAG: hypothetical protein LBM12_02360 [Candidatus Nomurabacteria bacterium]|jgi:hypothetical protein|nr:hypothetical protein [Candidatus Nomurabacteria bacterium]
MYQKVYYARPVAKAKKRSQKILAALLVPAVIFGAYFTAIAYDILANGPEVAASVQTK